MILHSTEIHGLGVEKEKVTGLNQISRNLLCSSLTLIRKYGNGEGLLCEHSSLGKFRFEVETIGNYSHKPEISKHLEKEAEWWVFM